ncbi:hypothetical protein MKW98_020686 [Papaver atlanticum]|uniref:F-box/LRR-repeat protein 15-like leucin rich repeat domain-containing protein n=1 Tax=Papaver atlanticum TaxID=357466 RepID=A0AAD4XXG2_9MAGN|nr:hypothetical protein MKW98_020686 [Papaver atlanticum]
MNLSSSNTDSEGLGKLLIKKGKRKRNRTGKRKRKQFGDLPGDCLSLVYQSLKSSTDYNSFGLVCRHWLHVQNNIHESLWDIAYSNSGLRKNTCIGPENFSIILSKLSIRFKQLKVLCLTGVSEVVTDQRIIDIGREVLAKCCTSLKEINLGDCRLMTDKGLEVLAKCCTSLEKIGLAYCQLITDEGLEVLARYCASLKTDVLGHCERITDKGLDSISLSVTGTDSGICFLIQNYSKLHALNIACCSRVTGIGFFGCPKTLTCVDAFDVPKLTIEGIKAITSGGGIKSLRLSGNAVNNEAVITISKSCPVLKQLELEFCHGIQLEGWKDIGLYCTNLKALYVVDCPKLCHLGVQALCNGCDKLSFLFADSCNDYALDLFKRTRPNVHLLMCSTR